ncbi:MAG: hypothetical protein MJD61_09995, partial [Proteobacteria bacterium]|nr:hypothetical protein [Pseudomonadota bacterium]
LGSGLYAGATLSSALFEASLDKLRLVGQALLFVGESPVFGVGRGAFASTFPSAFGTTHRYDYPENLVAQWTGEWGIPVALMLLAACMVALGRTLLDDRPADTKAAALGLLALGVHNMVDFSLELLGVATVAAAVLGAISARTKRHHSRGPRRQLHIGHFAAAALCCCLLSTALFLPHQHETLRWDLESGLRARLKEGNGEEFDRLLKRAVQLYPSEPVFAMLAATDRIGRQGTKPGIWLNRAIELAPGWPSPHLLAAGWLHRAGHRSQAWLELRAAAQIRPEAARETACRYLREETALEPALKTAPTEPQRRRTYLIRMSSCLPLQSRIAELLDAYLISSYPEEPDPWARQAARLARRGHHGESVALLGRAPATPDPHQRVRIALISVLIGSGHEAQALELSRTLPTDRTARRKILILRARASARLGDAAEVRTAIEELKGLAGGSAAQVSETLSLLAALESELGNEGNALRALEEAHRVDPRQGYLARVALLAERLGDLPRALKAYSELCVRDPHHGSSCAERARLSSRLSAAAH